jgi:hypothetical protein
MVKGNSRERAEALAVFLAEAREGTTPAGASAALSKVYKLATTLHRLYTEQCNGYQTADGRWDEECTKRSEKQSEAIEAELRALFESHGLGLYLQSDPRGNPVGILTPRTGKYNTMGGAECGWRL